MSIVNAYYAYIRQIEDVEYELEQCDNELVEVDRILTHKARRYLQHAQGLIELDSEERLFNLSVPLRRKRELQARQAQLIKMHKLIASLFQLVRVGVFLKDRPTLRIVMNEALGYNTFPVWWKNKSLY